MKTHRVESFLTMLSALAALGGVAQAKDPLNIGSRRELFSDNLVVGCMAGWAQWVFSGGKLHLTLAPGEGKLVELNGKAGNVTH